MLDALGPWTWVIAGFALAGLELLAPGVFFVWLGIAALLTAIADWSLDLSWQEGFLVFSALSITAVVIGRLLTRSALPPEPGAELNRRGEVLVGRLFVLDAPILGGQGRLKLDDSSWRITGADAPAGATVRVVRVDGATLVVEAA